MLMVADEATRQRTACEAAYLLNEAVRQLISPSLIIDLMKSWMDEEQPNFLRIAAVRNLCILSIIVNLYRVIEVRDHFLLDLLFTKEELQRSGFPSDNELLGAANNFRWLEILRHQYAAHAMGRRSGNDQPGRLVSAKLLGEAWKEMGINDLEGLVKRLREEVAVKLEAFVQHLNRLFPSVEKFIKEDYPLELERGRQGR